MSAELYPEYRLAIQTLRDLSRYVGRPEISTLCERALDGDSGGLFRCGIAIGAVAATIDELLVGWGDLRNAGNARHEPACASFGGEPCSCGAEP